MINKRNSLITRDLALTELFIVVAIIAILTGMLLPALNKARAKAQSSSCLGNLRQLGFAHATYGNDFNDYFCPASYDTFWQRIFSNLNYLPELGDSVNVPRCVWRCPAELRIEKTGAGKGGWGTWKGTHYGMNEYLTKKHVSNDYPGSTTSVNYRFKKFSHAKTPSVTYNIGDKWRGAKDTNFVSLRARYCYVAERHGGAPIGDEPIAGSKGTWNVVMLDGHAATKHGYALKNVGEDWKDDEWRISTAFEEQSN